MENLETLELINNIEFTCKIRVIRVINIPSSNSEKCNKKFYIKFTLPNST